MQAVIYARVSSTGDRQSTERQVMDLTDYADINGLTIHNKNKRNALVKQHKRKTIKFNP